MEAIWWSDPHITKITPEITISTGIALELDILPLPSDRADIMAVPMSQMLPRMRSTQINITEPAEIFSIRERFFA